MDRPLVVEQARRTLPSVLTAASHLLSSIRTWHVFVAAFVLRLPLVLVRQPAVHTENVKAGFTLAQRGYLGDPFAIPTGPTAHLSPAYPAVVAAIRSITPSDEVCLHTLSLILAVVSSCNIAALLPVARVLRLPPASGTIAALIWLIPFFAWIELSAEHETPFTVAALLALVTLVIRIVGRGRARFTTGVGLGLAAGAAAYVTPTVLPVTGLATLVGARLAGWRLKALIAVAAGAALAFAVAILPYTLRNHQVFGKWFFMRDNFGLELAMSNGPNAHATEKENGSAGGTLQQHPFNSRASAALVRDLGEVEYNHQLQRAAFAWIKANPGAFLALVAERSGYMVLPYSPRWYQRLIAGAVSLMAIAGAVLLWCSRHKLGVRCLVAGTVGYLLVYLVVEHDIRYMYPALFLESLLAGSCAVALLGMWRERAIVDAA